jgi:hypothetical protein
LDLASPEEDMYLRFAFRFAALTSFALCWTTSGRGEVTVDQQQDKVTVKIDGKLFTEYLTNSNGKPILWPINGPTGAAMTRSFPMEKVAGEATDHPHQRSFWFTHGDVNGIDFWMEGPRAGKQVHKGFVHVEGGPTGTIVTRNDWVAPDGKKVLEDERRLSFFEDHGNRVIDFDITLTASEGPVTFGDTKEGSFGLRIAESMRVERGGKAAAGRIVNSEGNIDNGKTFKDPQTWGKRASWVDYSGPVKGPSGDEHVAGITILNHPSSFRFPSYWHVRTYGLFAANPFGVHDFVGGAAPEKAGNHTLKPGESLHFRYRVIFHAGHGDTSAIDKQFTQFAADTKASDSK